MSRLNSLHSNGDEFEDSLDSLFQSIEPHQTVQTETIARKKKNPMCFGGKHLCGLPRNFCASTHTIYGRIYLSIHPSIHLYIYMYILICISIDIHPLSISILI